MHYAERTVQGFKICLPRYCNFCLKGVQPFWAGGFQVFKTKKKTTEKTASKDNFATDSLNQLVLRGCFWKCTISGRTQTRRLCSVPFPFSLLAGRKNLSRLLRISLQLARSKVCVMTLIVIALWSRREGKRLLCMRMSLQGDGFQMVVVPSRRRKVDRPGAALWMSLPILVLT